MTADISGVPGHHGHRQTGFAVVRASRGPAPALDFGGYARPRYATQAAACAPGAPADRGDRAAARRAADHATDADLTRSTTASRKAADHLDRRCSTPTGGRSRHADRDLADNAPGATGTARASSGPARPNFDASGVPSPTPLAGTGSSHRARLLPMGKPLQRLRPAHIHFSLFARVHATAGHPDVLSRDPLLPLDRSSTRCPMRRPGSG